ncbi:glycosyltransferase [Thermodesulfobacteriota bacterium]
MEFELMLKILIGIPVLDNLEMTRACISNLINHTETKRWDLNVSLLVLDNGSIDDIAGLVRDEFADAALLTYYSRNPINLGVAVAWNQILKFSPERIPGPSFYYDFYVIANNDAMVGPDWLQPLVETMLTDTRIGWVSAMENGSPVLDELIEAHGMTKQYRVDPSRPYTSTAIHESIEYIYEKWGGHRGFCRLVKGKNLPLFIPYRKEGRSAVCFMIRPAMIQQIGFFDEAFAPIGIAEDLEYFLRMERVLVPEWLTEERYPDDQKWKSGFCGESIVHHNWCSTRQGSRFDGRKWDKTREKNWKAKFGKSRKYYTKLLP